jgi:hypothetical protein
MARKKKLELHGRVQDGKLRFDPYQNQLRAEWLKSTQPFSVIETLEMLSESKTASQLGLIWGLIIDAVKKELDDRGWDILGTPWTEEQVKAVLYKQYQVRFDTTKTLSQMDKAETSEFIDSCYDWCAGPPWYIAIPLPRPQIGE